MAPVRACQPGRNVSLWRSATRAGTGISSCAGYRGHPSGSDANRLRLARRSAAHRDRWRGFRHGAEQQQQQAESRTDRLGVRRVPLRRRAMDGGAIRVPLAPAKVLSTGTAASVSISIFAKGLSRRRRPRSGTSHMVPASTSGHVPSSASAPNSTTAFENLSRLGIGFYHMSNARIGQHDPGTELLTVVLTMPFH